MANLQVSQLSLSRAGRFVCYVAPALTLYLPGAPRRVEVTAALNAYRQTCPVDRQEFVSGSQAPAFTPVSGAMGRRILESHLERMSQRIDEGIAVWDGRETESWWFTIRGVPPIGETRRASFCQVRFPSETDMERVYGLALTLAETLPFLSGHGGYTAVFNAERKMSAFDQIFVWAKRYWGLEVEDLNLTLEHVVDRIKGANWLTFVGEGMMSLDDEIGSELSGLAGVDVAATRHGRLLRAGPAPVLGDRNRMEWPEGYAAVEKLLAPHKLTHHDEFGGRFEREGATMSWFRRLLEPDQW